MTEASSACAETTSASLGVRVSGMRVWRDGCDEPIAWGKDYGKGLSENNFEEVFELFFNTAAVRIRKEVFESLRHKLEALQAEMSAPTQFKGRLNELLSQVRHKVRGILTFDY